MFPPLEQDAREEDEGTGRNYFRCAFKSLTSCFVIKCIISIGASNVLGINLKVIVILMTESPVACEYRCLQTHFFRSNFPLLIGLPNHHDFSTSGLLSKVSEAGVRIAGGILRADIWSS